ncbi:hypothetical protein GCM10011380_08600 [Sphingomonas metalli]|uniref:Uncharacterized protein n=2 Tax=Sphingomonas metalli TaxID=1779358 RepID=A0A916SXD8_9SPHN|nr:hypothetical protein GCM10011380_08600 [Sphingomonas metalli]
MPISALHPLACDCARCEPRTGATRLADLGAAAFFTGATGALMLALAAKPATTIAALLALAEAAS